MIQKNGRMSVRKHPIFLRGMILAAGIMTVLWSQVLVSLADSTGTINAGSAKIREKADIDSGVIGSLSQGAAVNIKDEVQGVSGDLWYQVYVDANTTGYIRADLVDKKDGSTQSTAGDAGTQSDGQSGGGAAEEADSAMDAQYATVKPEAIKVRTKPSTSESVVDRLTQGAQVVVTGQSNGSDGKTWYYAVFTGTDGTEKTGFIRSDLLTLGDMVPAPEEEPTEISEPEPEAKAPVNNDYELTYELEEDGSYQWYLYDYTSGEHGSRQKLQLLLDATKQKGADNEADARTLVRQRIAIVVLVILVVVLIVAVIIMALKLRDVYYEEYEDEDEDDAEGEKEEAADSRRRTQEEDGDMERKRAAQKAEESQIQRRRRTGEDETVRQTRRKSAREDRKSDMSEVEYRDDGSENIAADVTPKRKAKNFLLDDDEFEFEFLNMEDKGL